MAKEKNKFEASPNREEVAIEKPYFHSSTTIYSKYECQKHNTTQVGGREL